MIKVKNIVSILSPIKQDEVINNWIESEKENIANINSITIELLKGYYEYNGQISNQWVNIIIIYITKD